jgi:pimeloyl-ACP methyl ester carboxylesterase
MGGCYTIVQQANHRTFDAIAVLGYSAIHTVVPGRPGESSIFWPWMQRAADSEHPRIPNLPPDAGDDSQGTIDDPLSPTSGSGENPFTWAFHFDDEPAEIVAHDMTAGYASPDEPVPEWRSRILPDCGRYMVAPGAVAPEAASIVVPVLIAVGERDVVPDPWMEPKAYKTCRDITVFVCSRMAHMHNFAGTREILWQRLHSWATPVLPMAPVTPNTIGSGVSS